MKRIFLTLMVVFLIFGLIGFTGCAKKTEKSAAMKETSGAMKMKGLGPVVSMGTPLVMMAGKKTKPVVIIGTGFKPKEEIRVLFTTQDGLQSDIGYALKPEPKPNQSGTWGTSWGAGRYVARKLIKGGVYTITAADSDYNPIASTVVTFVNPAKKKKKKK
jgi:hypothetical protein